MRFINNKQTFRQPMPSQSVYQATRSSIEQGIYELQEKMLKKKELELERELAQNILNEERMYRQERQMLELQQIYENNLKYNNALLLRTACDPYPSSVLYEQKLKDPASLGYLEYLENRRRENGELEYLRRLERLKEQSLALESRATNGYRAHMYEDRVKDYSSPIQEFSSHRNSPGQSRGYEPRRSPQRQQNPNKNLQYDLPIEQDSSALLQKYSKGIRAQEYNRDMQRLIEIEKKLRKMEQNPSGSKSYTPQGNESIVMPYQPGRFYEENRSAGKGQQRSNGKKYDQQKDKINQGQRTIVNQEPKKASLPVQKPIQQKKQQQQQIKQKEKRQIFENQKIGQVINKRKIQEIPKGQQQNMSQKYPVLDKLDNYIKKAQNRNLFAKPVSLNRPYTSKSRNHGYRQVSRSLTSAVSPLKSQRAHNRYSYVGKSKRQRAKSSKPQNSSRTYHKNNVSIKAKQVNSRLLALDPDTQKVFEDLLRKKINQKIQTRLQLLTCVFKDAKLRHERNQVEALVHRFDIEAKARKEVKAIINNDPKILRKHKMVVE